MQRRLAGLAADDRGLQEQAAAIERLREQLAQAQANQAEGARLLLSAEFDGQWLDTDPWLRPGTWVSADQPLGVLVDPRRWIVEAWVTQQQLERVQVGAPARFRPQNSWRSTPATVVDVDPVRVRRLAHPMLDARHGGPLATSGGDPSAGEPSSADRSPVTRAGRRGAAPVETLYRVRLALAEPLGGLRETRGQAIIDGTRISLLARALTGALAVIVRESGF